MPDRGLPKWTFMNENPVGRTFSHWRLVKQVAKWMCRFDQ